MQISKKQEAFERMLYGVAERLLAERDYWRGVAAFYKDLQGQTGWQNYHHPRWQYRKVLGDLFIGGW